MACLEILKEAKLSKRKREAREEKEREKADAAKRARIAEKEAVQPLGRGQRNAQRREELLTRALLS